MQPNKARALCVSIHDVAPDTWPQCERLWQAMRAVADFPLTWLVVPRYHGRAAPGPAMERALDTALARGHELALHGYTHLDSAPAPDAGLRERLLRTVYTRGEGEFAAIGADEARRRIGLGLAWFGARGWPVSGFVAPAWLLGEAAWQVLREFPFEYTTTLWRFHLLREQRALCSPSLVYTARNAAGRLVSPRMNRALAALLARNPLLRLSLHPRDAHFPALVRHAQHLVEALLDGRTPRTKAGFASEWRASLAPPTAASARAARGPAPH